MQPISGTSTEPVGKPLQPISEQSTAPEVLCNHSAKHQPARGNGLQLISHASTALA